MNRIINADKFTYYFLYIVIYDDIMDELLCIALMVLVIMAVLNISCKKSGMTIREKASILLDMHAAQRNPSI